MEATIRLVHKAKKLAGAKVTAGVKGQIMEKLEVPILSKKEKR